MPGLWHGHGVRISDSARHSDVRHGGIAQYARAIAAAGPEHSRLSRPCECSGGEIRRAESLPLEDYRRNSANLLAHCLMPIHRYVPK